MIVPGPTSPSRWLTHLKLYIFPRTPTWFSYSSFITAAIGKVIYIRSEDDFLALLNKRVQMGQSSFYVITYLDRAFGRLCDDTLNKFINSFYVGSPKENILSSISRVPQSQKDDFARLLEYKEEYYSSSQYGRFWKSAYHSWITEVVSAGKTTCRNIIQQHLNCEVPFLPQSPPAKASI